MSTDSFDFEKLYSAEGFHENGALLLSELASYLQQAKDSKAPALSYVEPDKMLNYWQSWSVDSKHLSESEKSENSVLTYSLTPIIFKTLSMLVIK